MRSLLLAGLATAVLALAPLHAAETATGQKAAIGDWGVDTKGLSKTVKPGDDFYRYVNEAWLKSAQIPSGLAAIDSFTEVYLSTEQRVAEIIKEAREGNDAPGSPEQQVADFYRSYADMARRNSLGITPIAGALSIIAGAKDRNDIAKIMAYPWIDGMMGSGVTSDADNPRRQIALIGANGLTMPSRDYYVEPGEPYAGYRKALLDYIASSFRRAGIPDAEARAATVMALETAIAKQAWSPEQMRDVVRMNHVMTPAELKAYAPGFPWDAYLTELKFNNQQELKIITDTTVRDNAKLFAETPVAPFNSPSAPVRASRIHRSWRNGSKRCAILTTAS